MLRTTLGLLLLLCIFITACHQRWKTEKEEVDYWNPKVFEPALSALFTAKQKEPALHRFDSLLKTTGHESPYTKAARFGLIANYYYFFTSDNAGTAGAVDSALAFFNTPELQNRYPRTYVGYLLFGGQVAYRLHQYTKANEYYFRAKNMANAKLEPCERTAFHYSIAMVLYRQQNFQQSAECFNDAYALQASCAAQTTAVILQQQEIQSNIGLCLLQLKKYDSAFSHFDKALAIANLHKDSLGPVTLDKIYGVLYGNKAKVYMALNRLEEAKDLSMKSIALNARPGYETENAQQVQLQLADLYSRQQQFNHMLQMLESLRSGLDTLPNQNVELGWRRLMATYYELISQPTEELIFFKRYVSLRDSLAEEQEKLTEADVTRQLKEKEQALQITVLKKNNDIAFTSLWITVILSLMAFLIIILTYQNYRRSKKSLAISLALNEEINRQKAAREEEAKQHHKVITEAVIRAQESERSLIGLELHDNINQVLTTVKLHNEMVLEGMGDPKIILTRTSRYLQTCIDEIRSLSKRLSAPTLGKISLEESVNDLLTSINLTGKVKITQEITGLKDRVIKQELHLGVYRIIQEQLNNVCKHADASEVVVVMAGKEKELRLSIVDNGSGFDTSSKKAGIGLMNMRTRAENLNGSFEITSTPGAGCQVKVVLPFPGKN